MSQSAEFFSELKNFLPKFVSPIPSYLHALIAFSVVVSIGYILTCTSIMGIQNEDATEVEKTRKNYVYCAAVLLVAFFVSDTSFSMSWKLRNKKVNGLHMTWRKWLPSVYGP